MNFLNKGSFFIIFDSDPNVMGLGPVFAIRKLLETQCPWALDEVDLFELNEAFAAQSLGVLKELKISPSKVCNSLRLKI